MHAQVNEKTSLQQEKKKVIISPSIYITGITRRGMNKVHFT